MKGIGPLRSGFLREAASRRYVGGQVDILRFCPRRGGRQIDESECTGCPDLGYWRAGSEMLCRHEAEKMAERDAAEHRISEERYKHLNEFYGGAEDEDKDEKNPEQEETQGKTEAEEEFTYWEDLDKQWEEREKTQAYSDFENKEKDDEEKNLVFFE